MGTRFRSRFGFGLGVLWALAGVILAAVQIFAVHALL